MVELSDDYLRGWADGKKETTEIIMKKLKEVLSSYEKLIENLAIKYDGVLLESSEVEE